MTDYIVIRKEDEAGVIKILGRPTQIGVSHERTLILFYQKLRFQLPVELPELAKHYVFTGAIASSYAQPHLLIVSWRKKVECFRCDGLEAPVVRLSRRTGKVLKGELKATQQKYTHYKAILKQLKEPA